MTDIDYMLRKIAFLILRCSTIPFFIREIFQRRKVTIILYHDIGPRLFEKHIKKLKKLYNLITLQEYLEFRTSTYNKKLPYKCLIITFDDGHKGNYQLFEIVKRYGIPITIFLCSDIVNTRRHYWMKEALKNSLNLSNLRKMTDFERIKKLREISFDERKDYKERVSLNAVEINQMKKYVDFQSHTKFHPILSNCTDDRSFNEIKESKRQLEQHYDISINSISYPNGDYSNREILNAKKSGYICGITVDCGFNSKNTDLFKLKRICMNDSSDIHELIVKVSGMWCKIRNLLIKQDYGFHKLINGYKL